MGIFSDAQGQLTPQSLVRSGRISNSFEMLWMFSLPTSMKKIPSKMIRPKFELVRALMHVIITCKYEKERMKNSREKVETPFFPIITLSVTMETSGWIWPNFKLIQALMYVIITWKYEKDPIKNSRENVETSFFPS